MSRRQLAIKVFIEYLMGKRREDEPMVKAAILVLKEV
jgi:hypothetical protein